MDDHFRHIAGFDGYRVSRQGQVESRWLKAGRHSRLTETWRPLKPIPLRWGHLKVNLSGDGKKVHRVVHRLVLEAFVGPCPPGLVCCHTNGCPWDNRVENLRWDSFRANTQDAIRHGTLALGSRCGAAKLTEDDVLEIRRLWAEGVQAKELASRFEVTAENIRAITSGKSWRHVPLVPDRQIVVEETPQCHGAGEDEAA